MCQVDPLQASTAMQDEEGLETLHTGDKAAPGKHSRCALHFAHDCHVARYLSRCGMAQNVLDSCGWDSSKAGARDCSTWEE